MRQSPTGADGRPDCGSDSDAPPPLAGDFGEPSCAELDWPDLERPLPALGLGVQLRLAEGRWYCLQVGRPSMFELNAAAACLVGSFDGTSSGHAALARLRSLSAGPAAELARSIFDMIAFLDNAELLECNGTGGYSSVRRNWETRAALPPGENCDADTRRFL